MRKQKSLTEEQIQELLKTKYVEKVFKNRIIYTNDFKLAALEKYRNGKTPVEIFIDAGINLVCRLGLTAFSKIFDFVKNVWSPITKKKQKKENK